VQPLSASARRAAAARAAPAVAKIAIERRQDLGPVDLAEIRWKFHQRPRSSVLEGQNPVTRYVSRQGFLQGAVHEIRYE
jgi:hypothetical protein